MNRNKKNLHKVTANVLGLTLASVMAAGTAADAAPVTVYAAKQAQTQEITVVKPVYLDGTLKKTAQKADGSTKEKAVNTLEQALKFAGGSGVIAVCGTVTISTDAKIQIPKGIQIKKAEGFKGFLFRVTGEGKLTVVGTGVAAADVDVKDAKAGADAFKIEEFKEEVKEPETETETSEETSKEEEKPAVPETPETPKEPSKEEEKQETPETPSEEPDKEPEKQPEKEPEKPSEEEEKPEEILVQMPLELNFKKAEEVKNFDFAGEGFKGEGTFAWEKQEEETKLTAYETELTVVFTPKDAAKYDYSKVEGWNPETGTVTGKILVRVEELKPETEENQTGEKEPEEPKTETEGEQKPETDTKPEDKKDTEEAETPNEETKTPEDSKEEPSGEEELPEAEPGKLGEVATEVPDAIPVGSLIDESGVQVYGDFIPFYVDLQVEYNDALDQLPDAGIGEILSAYELKLWDLKEDKEYQIPEGKKVKVMIPLPENAHSFSDLAIAHYLGNNEYEYFAFAKDGKAGNMTIEEQGGREYLTFETASFSPFNVGGQQIVGPGSSSKPSVGTNKPAGNNTKPSGNTTKPSGNSSKPSGSTAGSNTGSSSKPGSSQSHIPTYNAGKGNSSTAVIRPVKTGDTTNIAQYIVMGVGALVLAAAALILGKKKK